MAVRALLGRLRSLRLQLALGGALINTVVMALLFGIGYQLLDGHLRHELDRLIEGHYQEVRGRLSEERTLSSADLEQRLRESSDYSSGLFYIEVESPGTGLIFLSHNMNGLPMPDVSGLRVFEAPLPGAGRLRVHEYLLANLDVTIGMQLAPLEGTMRDYVHACQALLGAMFGITLATGWWLGRLVLLPISAISQTARRIGRDDLGARIPVTRVHAEMEGLAQLLNEMFERLESAFDQIRRFANEASHELKTPLALIRLHAERLLQAGTLSAVQEEAVAEQLEEVTHLNHIIDDLLFLSRAEAGAVMFERTATDPSCFLETFAQDAAVLAHHHECRFVLEARGAGTVLVAEKWLRQLLLNLLTNAINVSPAGGLIQLRSSFEPGRWTLLMQDDGPGLDAARRERMFDRFVRFSNQRTGERGSGLGLAISLKIAELHEGRLYARPRTDRSGMQMVLELAADAARHPELRKKESSPT